MNRFSYSSGSKRKPIEYLFYGYGGYYVGQTLKKVEIIDRDDHFYYWPPKIKILESIDLVNHDSYISRFVKFEPLEKIEGAPLDFKTIKLKSLDQYYEPL